MFFAYLYCISLSQKHFSITLITYHFLQQLKLSAFLAQCAARCQARLNLRLYFAGGCHKGDVQESAWVLAERSLYQLNHEMSLMTKITMKCKRIMLGHVMTDLEGRHRAQSLMGNRKETEHTSWEFVESCSAVLSALECNCYALGDMQGNQNPAGL